MLNSIYLNLLIRLIHIEKTNVYIYILIYIYLFIIYLFIIYLYIYNIEFL